MAKYQKRSPAKAALSPRSQPHAGVSRGTRVLLVVVVSLLVMALLGILAYGLWSDSGDEAVLEVGGSTVTFNYYVRRLELAAQESPQVAVADPLNFPRLVLSSIEEEEVALQAAPMLGVTVTDQEVTAEIATLLGVDPSDANAFRAAYRERLRSTGFSDGQYRHFIETRLAQRRARDQLKAQLPDSGEQVRFRQIVLGDEEGAQAVLARLQGGEDFAQLARELSIDQFSGPNGGEVDWQARGTFQAEALEEALFSLPLNQLRGPIEAGGLFYTVQVLERETDREYTAFHKALLAEAAYRDWLEEQRTRIRVVELLDPELLARAISEASP